MVYGTYARAWWIPAGRGIHSESTRASGFQADCEWIRSGYRAGPRRAARWPAGRLACHGVQFPATPGLGARPGPALALTWSPMGSTNGHRPPAIQWPRLAPEALHGLPGRLVATIDPYTEADPVATLAHVLAAAGNLIGPDPHARVQHDRHPCRLNVALVGRTGKGRKGTSWSTPRHLLAQVDPAWAARRVVTGLSSGEGLVYHVRDARSETQPVRERGRVVGHDAVQVDAGEPDKRLMVIEPELAVTLKVITREANILSGLIRQAWDSGDLGTLTKQSPLRASGAHVSLIGHITEEEVRRYLTETERANGFANRFLWLLVRRSKVLPDGDPVPEDLLPPLVDALRQAVAFARTAGELTRDADARALWHAVYPDLSADQPGLVGAILNRGEAQVLRLSTLYAVLDEAPAIRVPHLRAALALWDYAAASARLIFGRRLGAPLADVILDALRAQGPLSATAISGLFGRHRSAEDVHQALTVLGGLGLVTSQTEATGGRPVTRWAACAECETGE